MKAVSEVKTVALEDLDSMDLDRFKIIDAVPEGGPVAEGDNVYRAEPLWGDQNQLYMMQPGATPTEVENISVLHITVPDLADEEAIERLKQKVSARMSQA
ncbi:hypothetical protein [Halomonas caseinilytica]|uniref:hypothetical protein n=1 Tax=Halomonas caseinilytica TaxID=438744 RepID=UPI0010BE6797|nr:hypothetical protein [Halomonas caseinilytica]